MAITDNSIDDVNAKYFCAFADPYFKNFFKKLKKPELAVNALKKDAKQEGVNLKKLSDEKTVGKEKKLNESITEAFMKYVVNEEDTNGGSVIGAMNANKKFAAEVDEYINNFRKAADDAGLSKEETESLIKKYTTGEFTGKETEEIVQYIKSKQQNAAIPQDALEKMYKKTTDDRSFTDYEKAKKSQEDYIKQNKAKGDQNKTALKNIENATKAILHLDLSKFNVDGKTLAISTRGWSTLPDEFPEYFKDRNKISRLSAALIKLPSLKVGSMGKGKSAKDVKKYSTASGMVSAIGDELTDNLFGPDSLFGKIKSVLSSIGLGIAGAASVAGIGYALYKAFPYLKQKFKYMFKKIASGNSLAYVKFEADEEDYIFRYDLKYQKWILSYDSAKLTDIKTFPGRDEVDSFLETDFCKDFVERCKYYLNQFLDDEIAQKALSEEVAKMKDKNVSELLSNILKSKKYIQSNMYKLRVRYETKER